MKEAYTTTDCVNDLKRGNPDAVRQLWERIQSRLQQRARKRLRSRRIVDEEDVALVAFNSFCDGVRVEKFPRLADSHDLWQILGMLVARKAIDENARMQCTKRGGGLVRGESAFERPSDGDASRGIANVAGNEPGPDAAAEISDRIEQLFKLLDGEDLQSIAVGKLNGFTNAELSEKLGVSLRTIERKLSVIRATWEESLLAS